MLFVQKTPPLTFTRAHSYIDHTATLDYSWLSLKGTFQRLRSVFVDRGLRIARCSAKREVAGFLDKFAREELPERSNMYT